MGLRLIVVTTCTPVFFPCAGSLSALTFFTRTCTPVVLRFASDDAPDGDILNFSFGAFGAKLLLISVLAFFR